MSYRPICPTVDTCRCEVLSSDSQPLHFFLIHRMPAGNLFCSTAHDILCCCSSLSTCTWPQQCSKQQNEAELPPVWQISGMHHCQNTHRFGKCTVWYSTVFSCVQKLRSNAPCHMLAREYCSTIQSYSTVLCIVSSWVQHYTVYGSGANLTVLLVLYCTVLTTHHFWESFFDIIDNAKLQVQLSM